MKQRYCMAEEGLAGQDGGKERRNISTGTRDECSWKYKEMLFGFAGIVRKKKKNAQMELNLVRNMKSNKKNFFRYSGQRKQRKYPL